MRTRRHDMNDLPAGVLERLSGGSFFSSHGFAELWRTRGGTPVVWQARSGERVVAQLAGVEFRLGPLVRFAAMPDGCYGRLAIEPAFEPQRPRLSDTLLEAIAGHGYARANVFDFHATLRRHPAFHTLSCTTRLIPIGRGAWMPEDAGLCRMIRRAEREHIEVERFDWARHGSAFMRLADHTARRHGRAPRYDARTYQAIAALAERDPCVRWLWCEWQGQAACSHIYFMDRDVVQWWQSVFDKSFSFLKPNAYMQFLMVREAARAGITWMNLGATPAHADGLAYYKARWGGRSVTFDCHVLDTLAPARALARSLGSRFRALGSPSPQPEPEPEPVRG